MSGSADTPHGAERVFIHDIATPTAVALGMIDLVLEDLIDGTATLTDSQKKRLEKAQAALLKLQEMMSARRTLLIAEDDRKR